MTTETEHLNLEPETIMEKTQKELIKIAGTFRSELEKDENNLGLFIFGSVATGKTTEKSDLDLALICQKPTQSEPLNVRTLTRENKKAQISEISAEQAGQDINNFVDYRMLQFRQAQIVFDKKNIVSSLKTKAEEAKPTEKVIRRWQNELDEDKESLAQTDDIDIFKLKSNRAALWALRICLAHHQDFYEGGKTLEEQLQKHPEITDVFIRAAELDSMNLQIREKLKPLLPDIDNPWIQCAVDKLEDCQELLETNRLISAKMMLCDAIVYYGLFLQEQKKYPNIDECIKAEESFRQIVAGTFNYSNPDLVRDSYSKLNQTVSELISENNL